MHDPRNVSIATRPDHVKEVMTTFWMIQDLLDHSRRAPYSMPCEYYIESVHEESYEARNSCPGIAGLSSPTMTIFMYVTIIYSLSHYVIL